MGGRPSSRRNNAVYSINMKHRETAEDYDSQQTTVSGAETSKRPPMTAFSVANNNAGII
jgi:hypothetical protein